MPVTLGDRVLHGMHPTSTDLKYSIAQTNKKGQIRVSLGENNTSADARPTSSEHQDKLQQQQPQTQPDRPRLQYNDAGVMIFDKNKVYKLLI